MIEISPSLGVVETRELRFFTLKLQLGASRRQLPFALHSLSLLTLLFLYVLHVALDSVLEIFSLILIVLNESGIIALVYVSKDAGLEAFLVLRADGLLEVFACVHLSREASLIPAQVVASCFDLVMESSGLP